MRQIRPYWATPRYALLEGELMRERGQASQGLSGFLRLGVADQDVNPGTDPALDDVGIVGMRTSFTF